MKSLITNAFLLIIFIGCSSKTSNVPSGRARHLDSLNVPGYIQGIDNLSVYSPDSEPLSSVRFEEEQRFGEIYPALLPPTVGFGPTTAVDRKGNVYLADRGERTIHIYSPDGRWLTNVGRKGKGPGEFVQISAIYIHRNRLIAYDSNLIRIQIFTLNPEGLFETIIIDSQSWDNFDEVRISRPSTIFGLKDSTFLAAVLLNKRNYRSYYGYYTLDWKGNIISNKIVEQQLLFLHRGTLENGVEVYKQLPFTSKGIVDVACDGTIYHVNTRDFLIKIYTPGGGFQRAIYYPFDRDPLEKEEALDQFHPNIHSVIRSANFPDSWPALESMFVDDKNRIWVSTIVDDKKVYQWWLLENSGKLLAKFTWPGEESIQVVRNGKMYVGTEDKETRARRVVRYRIELEPLEM